MLSNVSTVLFWGMIVLAAPAFGQSPGRSAPTRPATTPVRYAVQWASRVVGVSSVRKADGQQFAASQALGRPSVTPRLQETTCAWTPGTVTAGNATSVGGSVSMDVAADEWIRVGFARPQRTRQVLVAESANPGAITGVTVYDASGREHAIYKNAEPAPKPDGLLRVTLPDSNLVVAEVKVTIRPNAVPGLNQIDAIGLSANPQPVNVAVPILPDTPKELVKETIGKGVNSTYEELSPVISADGKTLYFTRTAHPGNLGPAHAQDVWMATLRGNEWSEATNLGPPINNEGDNAISSMAPDGRTAYVINIYHPNGSLGFGVSRSIRTRAGWSAPVECKIANNYNLHRENQFEFAVSPDGKAMVLAVQRRDALGERDLYVTFFKAADGTWTEPKSLGSVVNTADAESSPFLAADGQTLYFSSMGHPGYGNGDIFVTRRLDDTWTNWSEPVNLGPVVNTDKSDTYFTIPAKGDYAYLVSRDGAVGESDIFRLKLPPSIKPEPVAIVSGQVLDAFTQKPVAAEVMANQLTPLRKPGEKIDYDPETGDFRLVLSVRRTYQLVAKRDGYFGGGEVIDLSRERGFVDIRQNILLSPVRAGQKMVIPAVQFVQSKTEFLPGAEEALERIVQMLTEQPTMNLMVEGHTDNQGDWNENLKLSQGRVDVVKAYLVSKGVVPGRIQTKAWGPSKPIAPNATEVNRRLNRRVEFTLLKP